MNKKIGLLAAALALAAGPLAAETFEIDPMHSGVNFRVAHMMVGRVRGRFEKFSGTIDYDKAKPKTWKAEATIDAASISTDVEARDNHLRSPDFFDVAKFPEITFKTKSVKPGKDGKAVLIGELTIHGVTKPVALDLEIAGTSKDPKGATHLGASATTKINRKDFGLVWNKALEAGGVMVGDEVEISLDVEAVAKAG